MEIGQRILVTPKEDGLDITQGKEYEAEVYMKAIDGTGVVFQFRDNVGFLRMARQHESNHINKNEWVIK